jgi:hypothetical protein
MNIKVVGAKTKRPALTVADMKPGTVYRVWDPFDGGKPDRGEGQVCLRLWDDKSVILSVTKTAAVSANIAYSDSPGLCGHPDVRVVEVYGELTGIEVTPIEESSE